MHESCREQSWCRRRFGRSWTQRHESPVILYQSRANQSFATITAIHAMMTCCLNPQQNSLGLKGINCQNKACPRSFIMIYAESDATKRAAWLHAQVVLPPITDNKTYKECRTRPGKGKKGRHRAPRCIGRQIKLSGHRPNLNRVAVCPHMLLPLQFAKARSKLDAVVIRLPLLLSLCVVPLSAEVTHRVECAIGSFYLLRCKKPQGVPRNVYKGCTSTPKPKSGGAPVKDLHILASSGSLHARKKKHAKCTTPFPGGLLQSSRRQGESRQSGRGAHLFT